MAAYSAFTVAFLAGSTACLPPADEDLRADPVQAAGRPTGAATAHAGPVVLVTFSNLRADAIGYLGGPQPTPHFDTLARRADLAGSAVAASSSGALSAASLILGVNPIQHRLLHYLSNDLRDDLPTLGTALGAQGYHSTIHYEVAQRLHSWGFFRGFDTAIDLDPGLENVTEHLRSLDGSRQFLWIHLNPTDLPWTGPDRLALADLLPYADESVPLPEEMRDRARRLYLRAVGRADHELGLILRALDESGHRDETLLAVTALHGLETGEHGQILFGLNLGRASIHVPLLVDLPDTGFHLSLGASGEATDPTRLPPVAATRLWSTLVQVTGGERLPLHAPSLFEPGTGPALSALYLGNGINQHSAVFSGVEQPTEQILVDSRFAAAEPQFHLAQRSLASLPAPGLSESPRRIMERLRYGFVHALPWSTFDAVEGESTVRWRLERWTHVRGTEAVDDEAAAGRRAAQAYATWMRWMAHEEAPDHARRPDIPGSRAARPAPDADAER